MLVLQTGTTGPTGYIVLVEVCEENSVSLTDIAGEDSCVLLVFVKLFFDRTAAMNKRPFLNS